MTKIVLNRATKPPEKKSPEAGAWRSIVTIIAGLRSQIAALSVQSSPTVQIGDVVQFKVADLEKMYMREITLGDVSFVAFMKDGK